MWVNKWLAGKEKAVIFNQENTRISLYLQIISEALSLEARGKDVFTVVSYSPLP